MKEVTESWSLGRLLQKIAPQIGATVQLEPEWEIAGQITFASGKRSYFKYNTTDVNPVGSSEISKDKDYANFFIQSLGYPIVPGSKTFFAQHWADTIHSPIRNRDAAYDYAVAIGFPVVVKPNSGSQGVGVTVVHSREEFYAAIDSIFTYDRIAIVQKQVTGKDYRVVVLGDKVISAYERTPLTVTGDGASTIQELISTKLALFTDQHRFIRDVAIDPRIKLKLQRQNMSMMSVPLDGHRIPLLDNANLSTGGDSRDVTCEVHPEFARMAIQLTKDMGLQLCGVDFMIDGDISELPKQYWILETNSAPGLDHYVQLGDEQRAIVEDLYLQILQHIDRS